MVYTTPSSCSVEHFTFPTLILNRINFSKKNRKRTDIIHRFFWFLEFIDTTNHISIRLRPINQIKLEHKLVGFNTIKTNNKITNAVRILQS